MFTEVIQRYEQGLTLYESLSDHLSIATIIFWAARAKKERQELTADSSILKLLPKPPYNDPKIEAIDHMIQALLAEANKNWGMAIESWQAALVYENLDIELNLFCQRAILEFRVKIWMEYPEQELQESLSSQLEELEEKCKINRYFEILCLVLLTHAKFSFASAQFDEVEDWLNQCSEIAENKKLLIYQEAVKKEKTIFLRHRARIQEEIDKLDSPEEQMKVLQDYIKEALESLRKEDLI